MGALIFIYSAVVYLGFFLSFLYLIAFLGGDMIPLTGLPKTIDAGPSGLAGAPAALVNIGLLLLFGLQHSIMARQGFKRALTKLVPWPAERSTYVLATVVILVLTYALWIPMPATVWSVSSPIWSGVLTALFFVGFGIVFISTFLINHFELFGLMQGWFRFEGKATPKPQFVTPLLYKFVRHPLYLGFIIAFWATPQMSVGHLLFAAVWTAYMLIAIGYEERDLTALFGDQYRRYMAETPAILPFGRGK